MSRRNNNVRGPTSALTEFLRESGITPTTIARRVRTREVEQPVAGPSTEGQAVAEGENDEPAHEEEKEYASDNLDDTDTEKPPPSKKRKLTKAQEAKQKAAAKKAAAKKKGKKGDDDDYSDNEDEDAYTALSKMWKDETRPPNGGFCTCAKCGKQFTVTKYTQPATPPPGYLCHPCFKSTSSSSPFKKPLAPRKRKTQDKRSITNFEERRIASLASLCVGIVSRCIDDVEALGEVGSVNLERIAKAIARDRSLTSENVKLLYDVANTTLTLYDATNLIPSALTTLPLLNPSLTSLRLDFCGRLTSSVLTSWSTPGTLPHLKRLELLGPFLVHPEAWCAFFEAHGKLEGFLVTQSPRFDLACVQSLVSHCPNLRELRLKEIGLMSEDFLLPLATLRHLTYLDISHPGIPDALSSESLVELMKAVGGGLEHLNLSGNGGVDDGFLMRGLKRYTRVLGELVLEGVGEVSDVGVARFFDTWREGPRGSGDSDNSEDSDSEDDEEKDGEWTPNPPLTLLSLARNPSLSSLSLLSLLTHSGSTLTSLSINSWRTTSHAALMQIGRQAKGLERVDVGWCREVDDFVVKGLLDGCGGIREVRVWGCQRVGENCPRKRGVSLQGVEAHAI